MSEKRSINETLSFFKDLEKKASAYPVHIVKITRDAGQPLGLLLLQHGVDPKEAVDILKSVNLSGRLPDSATAIHTDTNAEKPGGENFTCLPEQPRLEILLATELDRVRGTRLPCSLVLIELDDLSAAKDWDETSDDTALDQLTSIIQDNLHLVDLFGRYGKQRFSIVLPGTNLGKAKNIAARIRTAVKQQRLGGSGKPIGQTVSIGIAVCHSYDAISPEKFLEMAMRQLQRAKKNGGDRLCHASGASKADSCQVSLDERALLLNFSKK